MRRNYSEAINILLSIQH